MVIATCALGMGINFPKVRYVVQYGPPMSIVDRPVVVAEMVARLIASRTIQIDSFPDAAKM